MLNLLLILKVVEFPSITAHMLVLEVTITGVGSIWAEDLHFWSTRTLLPPRMALADSTTLAVIFPSSHQITILSTQSLKGKFSLVQFTHP